MGSGISLSTWWGNDSAKHQSYLPDTLGRNIAARNDSLRPCPSMLVIVSARCDVTILRCHKAVPT